MSGFASTRLQDEADRVAALRDRSPQARAAMHLVEEMTMVPGSVERHRVTGVHLRMTDAMTAMCRQSYLRHKDGAGAWVPPFSPWQIAVGMRYRDLVERHQAGGVRCASLEAQRGGGGGGEFIDAFVAEGVEIDRMRRQIGGGVALAVRRIRPSLRAGRRQVTVRGVVDAVCLDGLLLGQVLRAHGWARDAAALEVLRGALCGALDRMMGVAGRG
jgi:hypothetical protein